MDAKLGKISELSNILCEKDGVGQKIVAVGHDQVVRLAEHGDREELLLPFSFQSLIQLAQSAAGYRQAVSPHSGEPWRLL